MIHDWEPGRDTYCWPVPSDSQQNRPERRGSHRFSIECRAQYRIVGAAFQVSGCGETVDISNRGVLLTADQILAPGSRIEVRIDWPAKLDGRIPLQLVIQGQVVRSVNRTNALSIGRHEYRTALTDVKAGAS
jgi:hypothetical protein